MDPKGRMGAAHVSARAVRAVGLLAGHCGGRKVSDEAVAVAIDDLVELIEMANDYRIKVYFEAEGEEPWDSEDDSEDVARFEE